MTLAPMLKEDGRVIGDFSLACLEDGSYLLIGSGLAEDYHMRWFLSHLPDNGSVVITSEGLGLCGLTIAGPQSRAVLACLTPADVSHEAFKFMAIRDMNLGMVPALVGRISYTGDLGYEIWVKPEYQRRLFDDLMAVGEIYKIGLFGSRALNALRLEKTLAAGHVSFGRFIIQMKRGWSASVLLKRLLSSLVKRQRQRLQVKLAVHIVCAILF